MSSASPTDASSSPWTGPQSRSQSPLRRQVRITSAPTSDVIGSGPVYVRDPRQWVLGQLTVSRDVVVFEGTGPFVTTVVTTPLAAIRRCRPLPLTAADHDLGVFEVTLRAGELSERTVSNWPRLGTLAGIVWFRAASTETAVQWAELIDDAAAAAHEEAAGRDASWWRPPSVEPLSFEMSGRASVAVGVATGQPLLASWELGESHESSMEASGVQQQASGAASPRDDGSGPQPALPPQAKLVDRWAAVARTMRARGLLH